MYKRVLYTYIKVCINPSTNYCVFMIRQPSVQVMVDKKKVENVEYFSYLSNITHNARCALEIKCRIAMAKTALYKEKTLYKSDS